MLSCHILPLTKNLGWHYAKNLGCHIHTRTLSHLLTNIVFLYATLLYFIDSSDWFVCVDASYTLHL